MADALGMKRAPAAAGTAPGAPASPATPVKAMPNKVEAASIQASRLANLFTTHPYDGTAKTHFPRVAVTVTDWSGSACWTAVATIWNTPKKSESVPPFSVCRGKGLGFAVNNAANLHLFVEQSSPLEHSGNVRTAGPKAPMFAIPDKSAPGMDQDALHGFFQQLVIDTGWKPGAPTNMWIVAYDARPSANAPAASGGVQLSQKQRSALERAMACKEMSQLVHPMRYELKGTPRGVGELAVELAQPITVFGFPVTKVLFASNEMEPDLRSYYVGVSKQQLIKAASLKKYKNEYRRVTTLGLLKLDEDAGQLVMSCSMESSEG